MTDNLDANLLAETENYMIWSSEVEDEELYHLELGGVSVHLTEEEWEEFVTLVKIALEA
jgi:hypothetical protein